MRVNAGYVNSTKKLLTTTSGCPILAKNEYLLRHDKVCTHLQYSICKALGTEATGKWYTHVPKPVYEEGDITLFRNQKVHTNREVVANRSDIILKTKKEKTCTLIDVAIPADRNVVQKKAEKKLKYKRLCTEIQRMWNLKCTIVPVIIGATGIVTRSLRKLWKLYQENIRQIHYKRQLYLEHHT